MPITDAISEAQLSVVKAKAAATLDVGTGEASADLGTAQASVAYQLVIQILQDKVVELAPALIAVEIAAINEGIAAYVAEQELSITIERQLETKTSAVCEQVSAGFAAYEKDETFELMVQSHLERAIYRAALVPGRDAIVVLREVFNEVNSSVSLALANAAAGVN